MTFPALGYDQEADWEEGRPTDADALSPDWDKTALEAKAEFDSVDTTARLADSTDAVKVGTNGFEVTLNGTAGFIVGVFSSLGGDTEFTAEEWFDPNGTTEDAAARLSILQLEDSGGSAVGELILNESGGGYTLSVRYREDDDSFITTTPFSVPDEYFHARLAGKVSTGVGNDDGEIWVYVNGELKQHTTGIDNDTRSVTRAEYGARQYDNTWTGNVYFDECRYSGSLSPVWITEAAALAGSYGAAFTIEDTTDRYISLTDPSAETRITIEARIDPNALTMATNDRFFFLGRSDDFGARLTFDGADYVVDGFANLDSGSSGSTNKVITDAPHTIRLVGIVSDGADNGELHLYVDEVLEASLTGLDNDTKSVDEVRFGPQQIDAGTSGVFFMDDMRWADDVILPQSNAGSLSPSGALASVYTQLISLAGSISPSGALSTAATFLQLVAGSISPSGALVTSFLRRVLATIRAWLDPSADILFDDNPTFTAKYDDDPDADVMFD